jgi:hypothetical protein
MNKLTALSKLANAFHYLSNQSASLHFDALETIATNFHYIRRSLRISDLEPLPKQEEGYNGRMPTFF